MSQQTSRYRYLISTTLGSELGVSKAIHFKITLGVTARTFLWHLRYNEKKNLYNSLTIMNT